MKEIRDRLAVCGDCKNSKLIVWSGDAEFEKKGSVTRDRDTGKYYTLRCNWLKQAVLNPRHIERCEGKQKHGDS